MQRVPAVIRQLAEVGLGLLRIAQCAVLDGADDLVHAIGAHGDQATVLHSLVHQLAHDRGDAVDRFIELGVHTGLAVQGGLHVDHDQVDDRSVLGAEELLAQRGQLQPVLVGRGFGDTCRREERQAVVLEIHLALEFAAQRAQADHVVHTTGAESVGGLVGGIELHAQFGQLLGTFGIDLIEHTHAHEERSTHCVHGIDRRERFRCLHGKNWVLKDSRLFESGGYITDNKKYVNRPIPRKRKTRFSSDFSF